jgi:hypothetical protein
MAAQRILVRGLWSKKTMVSASVYRWNYSKACEPRSGYKSLERGSLALMHASHASKPARSQRTSSTSANVMLRAIALAWLQALE